MHYQPTEVHQTAILPRLDSIRRFIKEPGWYSPPGYTIVGTRIILSRLPSHYAATLLHHSIILIDRRRKENRSTTSSSSRRGADRTGQQPKVIRKKAVARRK
jgi:hypothetical protein